MTLVAEHERNCPSNWGERCTCYQERFPAMLGSITDLTEQLTEAERFRDLVYRYIDRMNDPCDKTDPLERIVSEFVAEFEIIQHNNNKKEEVE